MSPVTDDRGSAEAGRGERAQPGRAALLGAGGGGPRARGERRRREYPMRPQDQALYRRLRQICGERLSASVLGAARSAAVAVRLSTSCSGSGGRGGGAGSARTETVSATLRETAWLPSSEADDDLVLARSSRASPRGRVEPGVLQVVEELLGLVLEPQHVDRGAGLDVGEQHAVLARALDDRVAVRAGRRVADRRQHPLLEHRRHRVLEPLGLLVDLVPGDAEDVGEEALDQPVAADDRLGVVAPLVGERQRLVVGAGSRSRRARGGRSSRGRSAARAASPGRCWRR